MKNIPGCKTLSNKIIIFSAFVLSAMLVMPMVEAGDWTGNANFLLGQKQLDENDWQPVDSQFELGVLVDFRKVDWPVSIAIDFLESGDVHESGANKEEGYTFEQHIGARKIWGDTGTVFRPYIGGGVARVPGKIKRKTATTTEEQDDTGTGYWLGADTYWMVGPQLNLGLDIRYSQAEVTLFNKEIEAGGLHTGYLWVITGSRSLEKLEG